MKRLWTAFFFLATVTAALAGSQMSADWAIPDEAKSVENPIEGTLEALAAGKQAYEKNCLMCHGQAGKGDGPATQFIKPAPADISTAEAKAALTDGTIFYMISKGKKPMPPMEKKLSETERWQVVTYVRSLQANAGAEQ